MARKPLTSTIGILFIIVMVIPRQFGLLAANCNIQTRQLSNSKMWLAYSIFCGCFFTIIYPLSIQAISLKTNGIFTFIEITNHSAMYFFVLVAFIRITIFSTNHANYSNLGFATFDKCKTIYPDDREKSFIVPLTVRVIYLYLGYAVSNAISLMQQSENLETVPFLYKLIYFTPDLMMACSMLRFHTTVAMQIICCTRINQALFECMDRVQRCYIKNPSKRLRFFCKEYQTFNQITKCYTQLYELSRKTEKLVSLLMSFYILKAFAHMSSMVSFLLIQSMKRNIETN